MEDGRLAHPLITRAGTSNIGQHGDWSFSV